MHPAPSPLAALAGHIGGALFDDSWRNAQRFQSIVHTPSFPHWWGKIGLSLRLYARNLASYSSYNLKEKN